MGLDTLFADRDLADHAQVPVLLNTPAAERIVEAQGAVAAAEKSVERAQAAEAERLSKPQTDAATAELERARAELDAANEAGAAHLYEFRLTSVGSLAWENLVTMHPPTKQQRADHGKQLDYNPETFPVAAVAACLTAIVHPDGTVEPTGHDVVGAGGAIDKDRLAEAVATVRRTIKAKIKHGHWQQIWGAALRVNVGVSQVPSSLRGSSPALSSGNGSEPR